MGARPEVGEDPLDAGPHQLTATGEVQVEGGGGDARLPGHAPDRDLGRRRAVVEQREGGVDQPLAQQLALPARGSLQLLRVGRHGDHDTAALDRCILTVVH